MTSPTTMGITWRQQLRQEIGSVPRWQWAAIGVWWFATVAVFISVAFTDTDNLSGAGFVVVGLGSLIVPMLVVVALTIKVTYSIATNRFPTTIRVFEGTTSLLLTLLIVGVFAFAAWEDRQTVLGWVVVPFLAIFGLAASAIGAVFTIRGLLLVIAVLLFLILRRLSHLVKR